MSHSITKIWIHGVFSTKERKSLVEESFEKQLYNHLREILVSQFKCYVKTINGTSDHIHVLFLLNHNHSIQEIFHQLKGESSHWVNQNNFSRNKFAWQIGYGAFSVSESHAEAVEKYIENQKEHHRTNMFANEYDQLIKKYRIDFENR